MLAKYILWYFISHYQFYGTQKVKEHRCKVPELITPFLGLIIVFFFKLIIVFSFEQIFNNHQKKITLSIRCWKHTHKTHQGVVLGPTLAVSGEWGFIDYVTKLMFLIDHFTNQPRPRNPQLVTTQRRAGYSSILNTTGNHLPSIS